MMTKNKLTFDDK